MGAVLRKTGTNGAGFVMTTGCRFCDDNGGMRVDFHAEPSGSLMWWARSWGRTRRSELSEVEGGADGGVVADLVVADLDGEVEVGERPRHAKGEGAEFVEPEIPLG